jgi:hypothetical protein
LALLQSEAGSAYTDLSSPTIANAMTNAMTQALHSQARTTHLIRKEIRTPTRAQHELAERYNVNRLTTRKWQNCDSAEDGSHRPNIVVALRTTLLLANDDLLAMIQDFINLAVSRSALGRRLRRHGVSSLGKLIADRSDEPAVRKIVKDDEPSFYNGSQFTDCFTSKKSQNCSSSKSITKQVLIYN